MQNVTVFQPTESIDFEQKKCCTKLWVVQALSELSCWFRGLYAKVGRKPVKGGTCFDVNILVL